MKTALFLAATVIAFAVGNVAYSQAPATAQSAVQKLQTIQARNKELLGRQTEMLRKLEELQLEAKQLKFLGKRS